MPASVTIDKENKLTPAEDYHFLRKEGIRLIQNLSGKIWTDYNTHDPGITMLEAFCYALTDLGYRANFGIKDILTPPVITPETKQHSFYTARQVLPSHPLTLKDYRKLIIDMEGVRNAWLEVSDDSEMLMYLQTDGSGTDARQPIAQLTYDAEKAGELVRLKGLYKVYVEYESDVTYQKNEEEVAQKIKERLNAHRNLCEDFINVTSIEYEYFTIEAEIQVSEGMDIEKINARIYEVIYNFFSPPITFCSLEQMLAKGYSAEDIFEGPLLRHGFIEDAELEKSEKYKDVHLSDIMRLISGIEGVIAIKKFTLPTQSQSAFSDFTQWLTNVKDSQRAPRLDVENSRIKFVRSGDRHRQEDEKQPNKERVLAMFSFFQSANFKSRLKGASKDLPVPTGDFMNITEYFPIQKSLPAVYGLSESYLDPPVDQLTLLRAAYDLLDAQIGLTLREVLDNLRREKPDDSYLQDRMNELLSPDLKPEEVEVILQEISADKTNAAILTRHLASILPDAVGSSLENQISQLLSKHRRYPVSISFSTQNLQRVAQQTVGLSLFQITEEEDIRRVREAYRLYQLKRLDTRQRLVLQLRGFLMVFEQLLADYLGSLANLRDTLSFNDTLQQTYFPQLLEEIPDRAAMFLDFDKYQEEQLRLGETEEAFTTRRNQTLDHLMARFGEDMNRYTNYFQTANGKLAGKQLIMDKIAFLQDLVGISTYRSQGFNYSDPDQIWDSTNVSGTKKRICRLLGMKDYSKKFISNNAIFIQEVMADDKVQRYVVVLTDPADRNSVLLRSLEYEFENEAQEILNYIVAHGAEIQLYEKEGRRDKWNYHLKRKTQENDDEIIASQSFPTQKAAEMAFEQTIKILIDFSKAENFHLVEHILLRPKVSPRERSGKRGNILNSDAVDFLTVNTFAAGEANVRLRPESATYKFRILNTKNEGKTNWSLTLNKDDNSEVLIVNKDFIFYRHLTRRIEQIRQFASDRSNFSVEQNADGYYFFCLLDVDRTLAESKKRYRQPEEMEEELNNLITFFSHEQLTITDESEEENSLAAQADPYSFQISILIPNWPAKFRNITFKHLLEKTIYMETPAHIYPQVYWLDHQQMRQFEEAYKLWLEELPQAEISNTEVVNNLIYQLNELRK